MPKRLSKDKSEQLTREKGRRRGKKSAKTRMEKLTPEQRRKLAATISLFVAQ